MFKLDGDEAKINIYDLLHDGLPDERKQELAESLTCADYVIKAVADQILEGWTENGFHGGEICSVDSGSLSPLQKARLRVADGAGEQARKEIERLQSQLKNEVRLKNEYMDKYLELYLAGYVPSLP